MKSIITIILTLALATPLMANQGPSAEDSLKKGVAAIISIVKNPELSKRENQKKRDQEVLAIAKEIFDFKAFSRGALGSNWKRFKPEQQEQFSQLFAQLIAYAYLDQLKGSNLESISISYQDVKELAPTRSGKQRTDITTIVVHDGTKTPVDYRLFNAGTGWLVYDVKIEGVSMIANYREQYRQKFAESPEKIISELKKKLGNRIEI